MKQARIVSVDVFRLIAIISVITIHTCPFRGDYFHDSALHYLGIGINQFSRYAVPFFFVISGFFGGGKVHNGGDVLKISSQAIARILGIFFVWALIYLFPFKNVIGSMQGQADLMGGLYSNLLYAISHPKYLFMQGASVHLWFLVALVCAITINLIFIKIKKPYLLAFAAVALYVAGVLAGAYKDTPIGFDMHFNTRNGPFFSTICFATGYFLSKYTPNKQWFSYGLLIACAGCLTHIVEISVLWLKFGVKPTVDYVFGTYFMGVGVALIALSNNPLFEIKKLGKVGAMTLGVYVCHYIFVDLLWPIDQSINSPLWEISYVLIVYGLSLLTVLLLSRYRFTRKFVL